MSARASQLCVLLLAAGKGTRMKSRLAKVLHPIAGRPMVNYPLDAADVLGPDRVLLVVGHHADDVRTAVGDRAELVEQAEQRGTGHAVLQARDALSDFDGDVLILYGDTPLVQPEALQRMVDVKADSGADLVMLTAAIDVPGIVVRDSNGKIARIVEATDATPDELSIRERNTGVYLVDSGLLWSALDRTDDDNAQSEIYLTSIIEIAVSDGRHIETIPLEDGEQAMGINNRVELATASRHMRARINERHMRNGVTIVDPETTYIDAEVVIGADTLIEPGCVIQGSSRLGAGVHLKPQCTIESSELLDDVVVGPSAHLRPGTRLGVGVRIGNFVEIKNSTLGDGCKADHLTYIGDADVGEGASFGCGSIVVNYDGIEKHRTTVGDRAFVGCNSNLIAPVRLSDDSFIAAGSTVTHDVPEKSLGVARARQRNVDGWVARREKRLDRDSSVPGSSVESTAGKKGRLET
ncbi:bifunctional UDP-N-acetylglucosamine diphosphorylase/glucosamine-1-phosphate N-acetyltransferase GlmU [Myxococcota bacterium]|nr:bifunctional UDP-N-acetylglucosamine diphosphorylase/glucosamine-1-phosphate N-acetyltransferase GlmU [Myxococcota bacterium]